MISMTGFSSATLSLILTGNDGHEQELQLSLMLKTLNSRYFEASCRLPASLSFLETDLIKYFKQELHRGTIQFTIYMSSPSALTGVIQPSFSSVEGYLTALKQIQEKFSLPGTLTIQDIASLPTIFESKDTEIKQTTIDQLWSHIRALTADCQKARIEEGKALEHDIRKRASLLHGLIDQIAVRAHEVMEAKKASLLENLKNLLKEIPNEITAESLISTTFNHLEKLDVHEELVRFRTHLEVLTELLASPDIFKGKKLDFTLQELFREINTIASKCSDAGIATMTISVKVEIEKAREQAQNII